MYLPCINNKDDDDDDDDDENEEYFLGMYQCTILEKTFFEIAVCTFIWCCVSAVTQIINSWIVHSCGSTLHRMGGGG